MIKKLVELSARLRIFSDYPRDELSWQAALLFHTVWQMRYRVWLAYVKSWCGGSEEMAQGDGDGVQTS